MRLRRVVITGTGAVSPFGRGSDLLHESLALDRSAVSAPDCLTSVGGLGTRVAGLVPDVDIQQIPRTMRRSMSAMSAYAYLAAQEAIAEAGLDPGRIGGGRFGVAVGSTLGSPETLESFFRQYIASGGIEQMKSMLFFRSMGHSAAVNVAQALGVTGRVLSPSAACASGCQATGLGYEAIAFGRQDYMLCGGADEYHPLVSGAFDIMTAASTAYNATPQRTPRPFDADRDGVVCSEGAGMLLLESLDSAQARGAPVLAEILGFACGCDPGGIAAPSAEHIASCMRAALEDAAIPAGTVDYVNAHATGTVQGDIAESQAIFALFGDRVPVSSLKGHLGHCMAASGALETIAVTRMLRERRWLPTKNFERPDDRCADIFLPRTPLEARGSVVVKNSFAFGGMNCTLILKGSR
jgi:3-oxoacyl-[acyl-carrier-protein] synthase II